MKNSEEVSTEEASSRWFLDLDWYQQNNRSLLALTQHCLCHKCRERLGGSERQVSIPDLLSTIRDCCSQDPEFVTSRLPILENVFRLILANGNQPLDSEELQKQLNELHSGGVHHASIEILSRLLSSDQYYGLRRASD